MRPGAASHDAHRVMVAFAPPFDDLLSILDNTVAKRGASPAFGVRGADGDWHYTTWSEFASQVDAFRGALAERGVARGDRVAVIANNRLAWAVGAYATYGRGATYVPMYEAMLDKDLAHILEDCGATLCLVAGDAVEARVRAVMPGLPLVNLDRDFAPLVEANRRRPSPPIRPAGSDIAYFIYTSGTTGKPKGVRLAHRNLAWNVQAVDAMFPLSGEDRTLAFMPWAHVGGGSTELHGIVHAGASTAICEKTEWIFEGLGRVRPTVLMAVPRVWNRIYDAVIAQVAAKPRLVQRLFWAALRGHARRRSGAAPTLAERLAGVLARRLIFAKVVARFGGRLRSACSGAAGLAPDVAIFIDALGIPVHEAYGMTELSSIATVNPLGAARLGSVGKALPGVTVAIDAAASRDPGQGGEVVVYGHGVMAGYHNLPEETQAVLGADGGLRTGDVGRLDADGYLFITGRVKEIYKLENGKYVSPAPLEERVRCSPYIAQCLVYGANRPWNVAIIVPDMAALGAWGRAHGVAAEDLLASPRVRALIAGELARLAPDKGFERIEDFVLTAEELTVANGLLTPSLKMRRHAVVARHAELLEVLYAQRRLRA